MPHSPFLPAALAEAAEMAAAGRYPEHRADELTRQPKLEIALTLVQLAGRAVSQIRENDLRGAAKTALRLAAAGACAAIEFRRRVPPSPRELGVPPPAHEEREGAA